MKERNPEEKFPKNYLVSVACELRFVPLLEIQSQIPIFQREIREKFPTFQLFYPISVVKRGDSISETSPPSPTEMMEWHFSSQDKEQQIRVGINRISIVVTKYNNFNFFFPFITDLFEKFQKVSTVDFYTRIGFRYTNDIDIQLEESENIAETLLKYFNPIIKEQIILEYNPFIINSEFRWSQGKNKLTVRNNLNISKSGRYRYILDIDSYTEEHVKISELDSVIKELHEKAIEEFYKNVKDDFLDELRKED